jgi:hypothetical protein
MSDVRNMFLVFLPLSPKFWEIGVQRQMLFVIFSMRTTEGALMDGKLPTKQNSMLLVDGKR